MILRYPRGAEDILLWLTIFFIFPSYLHSLANANLLAQDPQKMRLSTASARAAEDHSEPSSSIRAILTQLINSLDVMQDAYFEQWQGTWPTSIDWTAAVLGTHISGTLSSLTENVLFTSETIQEALAYENLIDRYFDHVSAFYFGENAFELRHQAFDDMLWVVLDWLESIKFQNLHSELHYTPHVDVNHTIQRSWHGTQLRVPAAHRARLFYELALQGWDDTLCNGGMIWSPYLTPYKNAVTNELFVSASIAMYLYFPGDPIDSPFVADTIDKPSRRGRRHNSTYLTAAIKAYRWLKGSNMTGPGGLYADGFHIQGWKSDGDPGTGKCDVLNTMIYTYNQGIALSGLRGLWLATKSRGYLQDGHNLVANVIRATGWPDRTSSAWAGLGRGGILEEACDSSGDCSQDGQTFKGVFFHHLAEFCHPLSPEDERLLIELATPDDLSGDDPELIFKWHQTKCQRYLSWIEHNAIAALITRNHEGKFGMWWGRPYPDSDDLLETPALPFGAIDYRNDGSRANGSEQLVGALRERRYGDAVINIPNKRQRQACIFSGSSLLSATIASPQRPQGNVEQHPLKAEKGAKPKDVNDRGRGRTVETQSGGLAVVRALYQWKTSSFSDS